MASQLNKLNQEKIIRLKNELKEIVKLSYLINEKTKMRDSGTITQTLIIFVNFFLRFIYCLESVNSLLIDFENKYSSKEHSISLILRASLLDYLNILYLKSYMPDKNGTFNTSQSMYTFEFKNYLSSQIIKIFDFYKVENRYGILTAENKRRYIDLIRDENMSLFNDGDVDYNNPSKSLIVDKAKLSIGDIRFRLDQVKNVTSENYIEVLHLYELYSKYEHFGIISMKFRNLEINHIFKNILRSLFHLIDGLAFCLEIVKIDQNIENLSKLIRNEFRALKYTVSMDV